jgi:hypothetical protein
MFFWKGGIVTRSAEFWFSEKVSNPQKRLPATPLCYVGWSRRIGNAGQSVPFD